MNYYNEFDKKTAAVLRELIKQKLIAPGEVDERSIEDVVPSDLKGFTQCHFFAGIGGWSYALRLAGWPDDQPIWSGSCPCQPFSSAGEGAGFNDERHLWPAWFHLIKQCNPADIVGEQVASKNADPWLDLVQADLESMGYTFGCLAFPSAGIGAPQLRDRSYWLGHTNGSRLQRFGRLIGINGAKGRQEAERHGAEAGVSSGMAGTSRIGFDQGRAGFTTQERNGATGNSCAVARSPTAGAANGFWRNSDWLYCRDGKWRAVESGTFPLAHGVSERVGRLRGYGNAINPYAAKAFIEAVSEALSEPVLIEAAA